MKYSELLKLYKSGGLDAKTRAQVEADIEKQDSISNYLYEKSKIPELDDISADAIPDDAQSAESERFAAIVRRSIRHAFIKMGLCVGAALTAAALFAVFLLPDIASMFYYDPTETAGKNASGIETNRMSLDLAVYSELFLPCRYRNIVNAEPEGYGEYAISIPQITSYDGRFTSVNGRLVRNRLQLYDTDTLKLPPSNLFMLPDGVNGLSFTDHRSHKIGAAGVWEEAYRAIDSLTEGQHYIAYVSLKAATDYDAIYKWLEERGLIDKDLWMNIYAVDDDNFIRSEDIGMYIHQSGALIDWDREKYPRLSLLGQSGLDDAADAEAMKTHFLSMLSYMNDHSEIIKIMNDGDTESINADFKFMRDYIEEHGLRTYGFATIATKEQLIKLRAEPSVAYIYTQPYYI